MSLVSVGQDCAADSFRRCYVVAGYGIADRSAKKLCCMARLIVAIDLPQLSEAQALAEQVLPLHVMLKIGYESYYAYGPEFLSWLQARGASVMLDLKLHDIPRTVAAAMRSLVHPAVDIVTVHALGGEAMLGAAVETAQQAAHAQGIAGPKIFGVTILTSLSDFELPELGLTGGMGENVVRLAALARNAGCAGIVCSPHEANDLKAFFGSDFQAICPGIRPQGAALGDQRRYATPAQAIAVGADYLVVGRPITHAQDPAAATADILREMQKTVNVL